MHAQVLAQAATSGYPTEERPTASLSDRLSTSFTTGVSVVGNPNLPLDANLCCSILCAYNTPCDSFPVTRMLLRSPEALESDGDTGGHFKLQPSGCAHDGNAL